MKNRMLLAAALLCAALGASAKDYVPPAPIAPALPIEIYLPFHQIDIDIPPTGHPAIGGQSLLGMAIESSRANRGAERVAPFRELLNDYDFNTRFERALRGKFASGGISPDPRFVVLDKPLEVAGIPWQMYGDANPGPDSTLGTVMKVQGRWSMNFQLQLVHVRTTVFLVDRSRSEKGKIKEKELLWRAYDFEYPLSRTWGIEPDMNLARWKVIGKVEMERMLDQAIEQSTDMAAWDFAPERRADFAKRQQAKHGETSDFQGSSVDGRVIRAEKDWYWALYAPTGAVYSPATMIGAWPLVARERDASATAAGTP